MGITVCNLNTDEFIAWELDRPSRHEFFRGEVVNVLGEMGAHSDHVTTMGNIYASLQNGLRKSGAQVFMAQMRLTFAATHDMCYPDVLVTCDPRDLAASLEMKHPKLIIEELSPSSATFDRGDKFLTYRMIDALDECAWVDPNNKNFEG